MTGLVLAVAVMLAACGGAWKPAPNFNALVITPELVLRGEADGTVSALATVEQDREAAVGSVRLQRVSIEDAQRSPHLALARARGWQVLSKRSSDAAKAFALARRGVDEIVRCCHSDAGMYMHAAELAFAQGRVPQAVEQAQGILADLIELYVRRNHAAAM